MIMERLIANGYEAYMVGGTVRDYLLGKTPNDIDIATNAKPEKIIDLFKDRNVNVVGKSFGVVLVDGVEVATYRSDRYFGLNDKNVKIEYADSIEEDLARRDFTINAMALDLNGDLIDPFGGKKDLEDGIVKFVGDPNSRIYEDPNRIVRACRFAAMFKLDRLTLEAIKRKYNYVLAYVARERIKIETLKAMKGKKPSEFFYTLKDIELLPYLFPSLSKCWGHEHGKHHTEDIFEHCMLCGDCLWKGGELLRLAGFLHDCGKPYCYDRGHFYEHELVGADKTREELRDLKFSNEETEYVAQLIRLHMRYFGKMGPKGARKTLKELKKQNIPYRDLIRLTISDWKASTPNRMKLSKARDIVGRVNKELNRKGPEHPYASLVLNGYDIMQLTGLPQSKKIGEILNALSERVLSNPKLNTREDLERIVGDYDKST